MFDFKWFPLKVVSGGGGSNKYVVGLFSDGRVLRPQKNSVSFPLPSAHLLCFIPDCFPLRHLVSSLAG